MKTVSLAEALRSGGKTRGKPIKLSDALPFKSKIKAQRAKRDSGCIEWTGCTNTTKYGMATANGKKFMMHRVSWVLANKRTLPSGKLIMHTCDNPSCINPKHLKLGTHKQNIIDCVKKGRHNLRPMSEAHKNTLRQLIKKLHTRGEDNNLAKLKSDQVIEIYQSTGPLKLSAKKYGVTETTICQIRRGKIWKHLTAKLAKPDGHLKERAVFVTINGRKLRLFQWAEIFKINKGTVSSRVSNGWSHRKALLTPVKQNLTRPPRKVSGGLR